MSKASQLRELLKKGSIIRAMGAHNALGAKLVEAAGFECVWASGLEISTSFAVPDANILTMTDFLSVASSMNEAIGIPVIADCDTGYGNSNNVIQMVRKYEAAGIAAVCIEDKQFPKVNSLISGRQELAAISEFVGKILAAKNAQTDKDFVVIARTEALIAGWGMEEAFKRAHAYADAGADCILIHSKARTPQEVFEFSRRWKERTPLVVVPTTYYTVTADELRSNGIAIVIYANQGLRAGMKAMRDTFAAIHRAGSSVPVEEHIAPLKDVFEIQGMNKMQDNELKFLHTDKDKAVAVIPAAGDHLEEYSMKDISSDIPIAMLDINGKPLLERQVEVLNRCRIHDVHVIGGYKKEKIDVGGIRLIPNPDYKTTGILDSVMRGLESVEHGRAFVCYGDILFDHVVVNRMLETPKDITILADRMYDSKRYGPDKKIDLVKTDTLVQKTRRRLHSDELAQVREIGVAVDPGEAQYEFPGMMVLSRPGVKTFKDIYRKCLKKYRSGKFHTASSFKKANLADFLQELVDLKHPVYCLEVDSGWLEIHSLDNYKLACSLIK